MEQDFSILKQRILQYIDNKDISKYKFYQESGITRGVLDKVRNIGVSKLELILSSYPELNLK